MTKPPLLAAALLAVSCGSNAIQNDRPAHIVDPTATSRAELQRVVSEALHVEEVMLADDALTDSSWLIIERSRIRSLDNAPLAGRDLGAPERFRLMMNGGRCVLVHEGSERRFSLPGTTCVAE